MLQISALGGLEITLDGESVACISSVCSLLRTFHLGVSHQIDLRQMADLIIRVYENWFRRNLEFRVARPGVIYDVFFGALVSDPIGTVRYIYAHHDLPWTDAYASTLQDFVRQNQKDKRGKHRYAASDFGLTEAEIADRLSFYSEHFGL
jgi:hypothetical protein